MPTPFAFAAPLALALSSAGAPADQSGVSATVAMASPAIVLSAAAPLPTDPITPQEAFTSLEGAWSGALTYRDYSSQKLQSIPVALTMETQPDGETMVQRFDYTDPGFQVYITNLVTVKGGMLSGATARAGRSFETYEKTVAVTRQAMFDQWTIVLEDEASDDDRPARIRETMTRAQGTLKVLKEVDYLDDAKEEWIFRNEITLIAED
ncbi:MAG: hypothetical protein AAF251_16540 [Pseudomonadota bacterium]